MKDEDAGSWNKRPYLFFCSVTCHNKWIASKLPKTNAELAKYARFLTKEDKKALGKETQQPGKDYPEEVKYCVLVQNESAITVREKYFGPKDFQKAWAFYKKQKSAILNEKSGWQTIASKTSR